MARIGFIGLGNMGLPMAGNLIKAGHTVTGFDVSASAVRKLTTLGGSVAADAAATCAAADAVITMLPAGEHVRAVYCGVLAAAAPGALLIDFFDDRCRDRP